MTKRKGRHFAPITCPELKRIEGTNDRGNVFGFRPTTNDERPSTQGPLAVQQPTTAFLLFRNSLVSSLNAFLVLCFVERTPGALSNMPLRLYTLLLAGLAAVVAAYLMFGRKKKTPAEIERERRDWLNQIGRITDGTVIDVQEISPNGHSAATMLIFHYDVGGVSYEASQDVTYLRQWVNLHSCRLGVPTSVRYDPQNPGNSIVVSEKWMGLRQ